MVAKELKDLTKKEILSLAEKERELNSAIQSCIRAMHNHTKLREMYDSELRKQNKKERRQYISY
jgi:hypothetical protein